MKTNYEEFIAKLGKIVEGSDRMILVVNEGIEVRAAFFNYSDIQKLSYLLQRTQCEWWIYPSGESEIKLIVRLF